MRPGVLPVIPPWKHSGSEASNVLVIELFRYGRGDEAGLCWPNWSRRGSEAWGSEFTLALGLWWLGTVRARRPLPRKGDTRPAPRRRACYAGFNSS